MRLVLFDIDGTLITDGGAARNAYRAALARVYGFDGDLTRYDFSGRTDPQITTMVLRDFGLGDDAIERRMPELWDAYIDGLVVNATRTKQLTNFRVSGKEDAIKVTPPIDLTLEYGVDFIDDDELVEITPKSVRVRKRHLSENERKRASRA